MSDGLVKARSDDSGSLKHIGLTYVVHDPINETLKPPIPKKKSKAGRGFNHPVLAYHLCPRELLDEFLFDKDNFPCGTPDPA